ncbi:MAG: NAD(P)-binding domain-containing protein [Nitrososphaerota archaeon]|nr:NAD(P)-binding domain-containing protein [Nitrososphaerota archaeon]MDG7025346.1 NAD(P)-binding domain-containing protein [Nitrososphaerota archaeon]
MKVAVLGGTGRMGRAIARQLSRDNEVVIGSRDPARASEAARLIHGAAGASYLGASEAAEIAVFVVPYEALGGAAELAAALAGKVVVSAVNPLRLEAGRLQYGLEEGSAAEELAEMLPGSRVATAFNHVSSLFFEKDEPVAMDILVAAEARETFEVVGRLVKSIPNLRPLYAGPLSQARVIERMTPLVLSLSKLNNTGSLTTKFVSVRDKGQA